MSISTERKLFGTDGIRGQANIHPLSLGRAVAHQARTGSHRHRIVIGKDTRLSGYMIEMAFASGVCSMGVDALLVGPMPTPGVAFITQNMRADAGVVVSASHNPYQDNGIKIFARDGYKLPDQLEMQLEAFMRDEAVHQIRPTKSAVGKAFRIDDALGRYIVALKSVLPTSLDLTGLKVIVDCANGAAYKVAPTVLQELGAQVLTLGVSPDGRNINHRCGALFPELLAKNVLKHQAHIGLALDGDADRLVVVDEQGQIVPGDALLAIGAAALQKEGRLSKNKVVATIMSNIGLEQFLNARNIQLLRAPVGDRYVMEWMRQYEVNFGGESSGHMIYQDYSTTGDGMLAALKLLEMMKKQGSLLSSLIADYQAQPQVLRNVEVTQKIDFQDIPPLKRAIAQFEQQLAPQGRVLLRYSGTEPLVRILVEGPKIRTIQKIAEELETTIKKYLG
jgi:phosphoglucosamine mutase